MAKQKTRQRTKQKMTWGTIAFAAIFLLAIAGVYYPSTLTVLLLALAGAIVAITNITIKEEQQFLIAVTALNLVILMWALTLLSGALKEFLLNLFVGFSTAGFIVATAAVIRITSTK